MGDFASKVLDALDDERVADKIRRITASPSLRQRMPSQSSRAYSRENEELKKRYDELKQRYLLLENEKDDIMMKYSSAENKSSVIEKELYTVKAENSSLEDELHTLRTENDSLKAEQARLKERIAVTEKYARGIAEKYEAAEKYYDMYCRLSDEIHGTLSRVLSCESPMLFVVSGSQRGSIEGLWDTIGYSYGKYSDEELNILKEIFDFFFELYNSFTNTYERLDTAPGDSFDSKLCIPEGIPKHKHRKYRKEIYDNYLTGEILWKM